MYVWFLMCSEFNINYVIVFCSFPSPADRCDRAIDPSNQNQYIVWGIGGLGETAFKHFARANGEQITDNVITQNFKMHSCKKFMCMLVSTITFNYNTASSACMKYCCVLKCEKFSMLLFTYRVFVK